MILTASSCFVDNDKHEIVHISKMKTDFFIKVRFILCLFHYFFINVTCQKFKEVDVDINSTESELPSGGVEVEVAEFILVSIDLLCVCVCVVMKGTVSLCP